MPDNAEPVLLACEGPIATITLNRPERRNGVTLAMCATIHAAVRAVAASDARVLVLRGAGDHFCVGADIGGEADDGPAPLPASGAAPEFYHAATLLHEMPQVTIAAIDGGCAGAGLGYAAACDLRFASHRARFSSAFLNVGVSGDMGLAWSLTRIVGPARARELMLLCEKFDGGEALAMGLVSALFEPGQLHQRVAEIAGELAQRDPLALRLVKANCLSAESLGMRDYIEVETQRHLETTSRPDLATLMAKGLQRAKGD